MPVQLDMDVFIEDQLMHKNKNLSEVKRATKRKV